MSMQTGKSCRVILYGGVALAAPLATPALAEELSALTAPATAARASGVDRIAAKPAIYGELARFAY